MNPTVQVDGRWYVIEMDKEGKRWAVSDSHRIPYGELFDRVKKVVDENHADRQRLNK